MVKKIKIREKKTVTVFFIGDIHLGTKCCAKKELIETIETIKKIDNARIILMGDLGDYIVETDTRRSDPHIFDKKLKTPDEQTQFFINLLEPVKHKIYGILRGNHEASLAKYDKERYVNKKYRDEAEKIAKHLKVPYLEDMGIIELSIYNKKYNIVVAHGCGGNTKLTGQINSAISVTQMFEITPDVLVLGHVHALQSILNPKLGFNFKTKVKYLGLSGTFYRTYIENNINYASSSLYNPLVIGCLLYMFTPEKIESGKVIYD